MPTTLSQLRQFQFILLMILMLCAVQVIQASPLHDHSSHSLGHTVDCALCHLPLSDDPGNQGRILADFTQTASPVFISSVPFVPAVQARPYQSRAPPRS